MIFQDNVIKEYLKNVYFITGTIYSCMMLMSSLKNIKKFQMLLFNRQ